MIEELTKNDERSRVLVVPTLNGVSKNVSFLSLLADRDLRGAAICIRDGNRVTLLSKPDQFDRFAKKVEKLRQAQKALPGQIKAGIERVKAAGKPLGGCCAKAHRFTIAEQSKGGRNGAVTKKRKANERYEHLMVLIRDLAQEGLSPAKIATCLTETGARRPDGGTIGRKQISRILGRDAAAPHGFRKVRDC